MAKCIGIIEKSAKMFFDPLSIVLDFMPQLRYFGNKAYPTLINARTAIDRTYDPNVNDNKV